MTTTSVIGSATPRGLADQILRHLDERTVEAVALHGHAQTLFQEARAVRVSLDALGAPAAGHSLAHGPLRESLRGLVSLGHNIEIAIRETTVLERAGINLRKLFEPREIDHGLGNKFRVEQDGPAQVVHAHNSPCIVAESGHLALDIPLRIEKLGMVHHPRLNLAIALEEQAGPQNAFLRILARGAHFCPLDGLEEALAQLFLTEISPELAAITGRVPLPQLPDLQIGQIELYAGMLGEIVRVHGHAVRRPRRRVPPLATMPNWADTVIKIVPEVIVAVVGREIARYGATIIAGPSYPGGNSFDLVARYEVSGRQSVGCKRFSWRVRCDFTIRTQLRIEVPGTIPQLILDVFDVDRNVDVSIEPEVIEWLLGWLIRLGEKYLEDTLPAIRQTRRIDLLTARRAEIVVASNEYRLIMQTRALFQA